MARRPIIGVPADRKLLGTHPFHCVGEKYLTAVVEGAGGMAVVIPALGERQSADDWLEQVDGILFTGSHSMLHPRHYNGADLPEGTLLDPDRDETNLALIRAAVAKGVPILGICRGFQEMNAAFGGSLLQQVHLAPGMLDHREDYSAPLEMQYAPAHVVHLTADGALAKMTGQRQLDVNSLHQQGVATLGEGLIVEATAPDGLIEAFRVGHARRFALAVQWHPEWQFARNPVSIALFRAFGDACQARQAERMADMLGKPPLEPE